MKRIFLASVLACLSVNVVFAASDPNHCPSVAAIQSTKLTKAQIDFPSNTYIAAANPNEYDTNASWLFLMGNIAAKDASDALQKASADMATLQLVQAQAVPFLANNTWLCSYQDAKGYASFAVSSNATHSVISNILKAHS